MPPERTLICLNCRGALAPTAGPTCPFCGGPVRPAPLRTPPVAGAAQPGCLIVVAGLPFGAPLIPIATHAVDQVFVAAGLSRPQYSAATWVTGLCATAFVCLSPVWYTGGGRSSATELALGNLVGWCYLAAAVYGYSLIGRLRAAAPVMATPFDFRLSRRVLTWVLCATMALPFVASVVESVVPEPDPGGDYWVLVRLLLAVAWFATVGLYSEILSWTRGR